MTLTHGSLFSGIGGIDLGFERAGIETIWQCEFDSAASAVLERRFPGVPNYHDVRSLKNDGTIAIPDIISGGFPCQDVSLAGRRAGLAGERSGLWFEYQRIIDEFQPKWVVAENVPGLLSSNDGNDFKTVIGALEERGYCVAWRVLDAQFFGVAQRRRRVFIVASLGNIGSTKVLFEREGLPGDTAKSEETRERNTTGTVPCLTKNGDSHSGFRDEKGLVFSIATKQQSQNIGENIANPLCANDYKEPQVVLHGYRMKAFGEYADDGTSSALKKRDHKDATDLVIFGDQGCAIMREETSGKSPTLRKQQKGHQPLVWQADHADDPVRVSEKVFPTLQKRMGTGGNQVPMVVVRRLTPTECERLQGFPDGWTDEQADTHRYQQLGNAVCVNVAEWIGRRIVEVEW